MCPILLSDSSRIIFKKTKKCPCNITFLDNMLYKVQKYVPLILRYYKEPNNFKAFIKQVYQKNGGKIITRKRNKIITSNKE